MSCYEKIARFFARFRYPVSLPEEIGTDLGVDISNSTTFEEFLHSLTTPTLKPRRLRKFMSREHAEKAFENARIKETFFDNTLFSYYFNEGCIEFALQFDKDSKLRRIYLYHKQIKAEGGVEIPLSH